MFGMLCIDSGHAIVSLFFFCYPQKKNSYIFRHSFLYIPAQPWHNFLVLNWANHQTEPHRTVSLVFAGLTGAQVQTATEKPDAGLRRSG
jgi:hypothetical protein